jgi:hypothetical protein
MNESRLLRATLASFVLGIVLMLAFNVTVTRILGVALIILFISLGTFTIATPEYLSGDDDRE